MRKAFNPYKLFLDGINQRRRIALLPVLCAIVFLTAGLPVNVSASLIDTYTNFVYQQMGGNGSSGNTGRGGNGGRGGFCTSKEKNGKTGVTGHPGGTGGTGGQAVWTLQDMALGQAFLNAGHVLIGGNQGRAGGSGIEGGPGFDGGQGGLFALFGLPGQEAPFSFTAGMGGLPFFDFLDGGNGERGSGAGGGGGSGKVSFLDGTILRAGYGGSGGSGATGQGGSGKAGTDGAFESQITSGQFINASVIQVGGNGGTGGDGGDGGQGGGGAGAPGNSYLFHDTTYLQLGKGGKGGRGGDGGHGGAGGTGTISIGNNGRFVNTGNVRIKSGSKLSVGSGGLLNNQGKIDNGGHLTNAGTLINNGRISGGGSFTQTSGRSEINGVLDQASIHIAGGSLSGIGLVRGNTIIGDGASLMPGNSPGTLNFDGDLMLESNSTTWIEIGGLFSGQFDAINVTGMAQLGGGLDVSLWDWTDDGMDNPFTPIEGDVFDIITAETLEGVFESFNFASLGNSLNWNLAYLVDEIGTMDVVRLSIAADLAPVPEPSTTLLLGVGLLAASWSLRRKTNPNLH